MKKIHQLSNVLLGVINTEKTVNLSSAGSEKGPVYTFSVDRRAGKPEIKAAIESLFGVEVAAVNTVVNRGRLRSFKGNRYRNADEKKAYVTLAAGRTINFEDLKDVD